MLLAIDVRNTHTVVGLISGSGDHAKVVQQWRIRTEPEVTADELALTIDGLIGDDAERLTGASGCPRCRRRCTRCGSCSSSTGPTCHMC